MLSRELRCYKVVLEQVGPSLQVVTSLYPLCEWRVCEHFRYLLSYLFWLCKKVSGKNDGAIVEALEAVVDVVVQVNQN